MQRWSERQRIEAALILACTLVLLYVLILSPLLAAERTAALARRDSARVQMAGIEAYQRVLLQDAQAEEKLHARMERADAALPQERGQGRFVRQAEQLARRSGIIIEGITPHAPQTEEDGAVQSVTLKLRGSYFDLITFLRAMEEDRRAVRLGETVLTAAEDGLHCVLTVQIAALPTRDDAVTEDAEPSDPH